MPKRRQEEESIKRVCLKDASKSYSERKAQKGENKGSSGKAMGKDFEVLDRLGKVSCSCRFKERFSTRRVLRDSFRR